MIHQSLHLITTSSLEKIFPDEAFSPSYEYAQATCLLNERFSYQIAYRYEGPPILNARVKAHGPLADYLILRKVALAPCELPNNHNGDEQVLRTTPGLYPDRLEPIPEDFTLYPGQWRSLWLTLPADCPLPAGDYESRIAFYTETGALMGECSFLLKRLNISLPDQELLHTEWFHTDCISTWYQTPVFSEAYWEYVDRYMAAASLYGVNMLLTPLFTPPLDTAVGKERPTVQLVDVWYEDKPAEGTARTEKTAAGSHAGDGGAERSYRFGFSRLERWLGLCDKNHIEYLEMSHLFTQWGAQHAPKIMAAPFGGGDQDLRQIFGWETKSDSEEYRHFLTAFLTELMGFIHAHHLEKRCTFHVSDEPGKEHLNSYLYAKNLIEGLTEGLPVMDALSDYEFYDIGKVHTPVCSNDHIEPFLEHQVPGLWTYYCGGQSREVSNRFFCMSSARNRILGIQLYKYNISGFLHWGFNFWYASLSRFPINPYQVTDAAGSFPSGDSFLVYPGPEGPLASLRAEVLFDGLQDQRCLKLLEQRLGRDQVLALIQKEASMDITFKKYPTQTVWLLHFRETCNRILAENAQ